jgi:low affinity Fe/Cu permease
MPLNFSTYARIVADALGTPWAFFAACALVVAWAAAGPLFGFSDAWQLVINTGTTIATFLIVFLIQNTQNRDAKALHLKLDELIRSLHSARNRLIDLEDCTDEELAALQREFVKLRNGRSTDSPAERGTPEAAPREGRDHKRPG